MTQTPDADDRHLRIPDDDATPPGDSRYPGDGRQDDPPHWRAEGALILRDGEVIALAVSHPMAFFLAAVLRRFSHARMLRDDDDSLGARYVDEHAGDHPHPGIGGL